MRRKVCKSWGGAFIKWATSYVLVKIFDCYRAFARCLEIMFACERYAFKITCKRGTAFKLADWSANEEHMSLCSTWNECLSCHKEETMGISCISTQIRSILGRGLLTFGTNATSYCTCRLQSRFWKFQKFPSTSMLQVIDFCKEQVARQGLPDLLVTDNALELVSSEFKDFTQLWQFQQVTSSPYPNQSNRKVEAAVKMAKAY